jgi:hypothetical protein
MAMSATAMSATETAQGLRGSQKLLEKLTKNGGVPSPQEIVKALNLPASAKIPNWLIRGIPPAYLTLEGTVQVPVSDVGAVVDRFTHLNDSAINLKVLIRGIPVPDVAHVVVNNSVGQE